MSQAPFIMLSILTIWLFSGFPIFSLHSIFDLIFSLPGSRKQEVRLQLVLNGSMESKGRHLLTN